MSLNRVSVITEVRALIGAPSTTEYADSNIDRAITNCLLEYSKYNPKQSTLVITLVPGQFAYTVSDNVIVLFASSYTNSGFSYNVENPFSYMPPTLMPGTFTANPTMQSGAMDRFLLDYQLDLIQGRNTNSVELNGNILIFSPTPVTAQTVYCHVGIAHDDTSFPAVHQHKFCRLVASIAAVELANLRSKFPSLRIGPENVQFRDPTYLLNQADKWRIEFDQYMGSLQLVSFQNA